MGSREALKLVSTEAEEGGACVPRFRVLLSAMLVTTTAEKPVKIRNLSFGDAVVEGRALPPAGTDVILKRGRLEIFGMIDWASDGRAGVAFDEPMSETELWLQVSPAAAPCASIERSELRRPGFRASALCREEREAAAAWASPVGREAYRD